MCSSSILLFKYCTSLIGFNYIEYKPVIPIPMLLYYYSKYLKR